MNRRTLLRALAATPLAPLLGSAAAEAPDSAPEFYRIYGGPLSGTFVKASSVIARTSGRFEMRRLVMGENDTPKIEVFWFRLAGTSDGVPTLVDMERRIP